MESCNGEHKKVKVGEEIMNPERALHSNDEEEKAVSVADDKKENNISEDADHVPQKLEMNSSHVEEEEEVAVTNNNIMDPHLQLQLQIIQPHSLLPKPEAPPGLINSPPPADSFIRSKSLPVVVDMPSSIGKFFKERSHTLSASIANRLSSLKTYNNNNNNNSCREDKYDDDDNNNNKCDDEADVTEFRISGLKVVVRVKNKQVEEEGGGGGSVKAVGGRISFFSRSNCRDCTAVRSFFREKGLKFVEINIDVFPLREKELIERSGNSQVPQIFFNDQLFGGLVDLNFLRNSGGFDQRLKEMLSRSSPEHAPAPPVYGFDDPVEDDYLADQMIDIVRLLRQRLPIQDRLMKMKIVNNCFSGSHMLDLLLHNLDCTRPQAVEIAKQLARKHFIHHVFGEKNFEDGNHFYRFLEHQPFIPKCFNFRGSTNDSEPKSAVKVGRRLHKIMSAILETYASTDRCHVDYAGISKSEEFRRYVNLAQDLQRVDLLELSTSEKLALFLNLHNAMVIHAVIRVGCPEGVIDRRSFYSDFQYIVGGSPYSLNSIKNGILRSNRRSPYSLIKPLGAGDKRLEVALQKVNPLIHFGLCNGTRSSPAVKFFTAQGVEAELKYATREFFQRSMEVDLEKRAVHLTRIIKWFSTDFGQEKEILRWIINYLDANKAGLLTHLLGDGGPINIVYQNYDWSVNS